MKHPWLKLKDKPIVVHRQLSDMKEEDPEEEEEMKLVVKQPVARKSARKSAVNSKQTSQVRQAEINKNLLV
jgi:hypothetical protein